MTNSITEYYKEEINKLCKEPQTGLQGWVCPKCGSVYAPYTHECLRCNAPKQFEITC